MSIRIEREGPVFTVAIDRKDRRNAVDRTTAEALAEAFRAFDADPDAKVGVLYGDHGTFCAGADLKAVAEGKGNRLSPEGDAPMGLSRLRLDKPVIAAIAGHAVAGGLELALWCDLRIAEEDAVLGVFCRRFGVPLIDGGTVRLPRVIGLGRALDLVLTGRPVAADEALAMGLVNRVVPTGTARAAAESLAREIARHPELCMRGDRRSVYASFDGTFDDAMAYEFEQGRAALSSETLEGAKRFAEGRGRHGRFDE